MNQQIHLVRGAVLHFLRDPGPVDDASACEFFEDGALLIEAGRVSAVGEWGHIAAALDPAAREHAQLHDYRGHLILPGLVDTHIHYPQVGVLGSFGRQLIDWLTEFTFPAESAFADPAVAHQCAEFVVRRMLAHGTTTASVFATVHPHSVDAFFEAASHFDLRMLCGKVMMDRNCPDSLCDTAVSAEHDSRALIERWHGHGRLRYTLTPRFAPTSTPQQLDVAGALYAAWPDLHVQSHLAENKREIEWVHELFPDRRSYLDVYAHHGLIGPRTIYGHCVHLDEAERKWMADTQTAAAFCPTSNLFLGSGMFDYRAARDAGMAVGLATDVGGGTSLSLIRTLGEAYKVSQFCAQPLAPLSAWYLATLGGARALGLEHFIGNFEAGKEADFVVLDLHATEELAWRISHASTLQERLFALQTLGDERCVVATHAMGRPVYRRD